MRAVDIEDPFFSSPTLFVETAEDKQVNIANMSNALIHLETGDMVACASTHDESEYDSLQLQPEEDELGISDGLKDYNFNTVGASDVSSYTPGQTPRTAFLLCLRSHLKPEIILNFEIIHLIKSQEQASRLRFGDVTFPPGEDLFVLKVLNSGTVLQIQDHKDYMDPNLKKVIEEVMERDDLN